MKIEKSHRFMGIGEGDNEMPEHLLEELRKRPIYYKSNEIPKEIQVESLFFFFRIDLLTCIIGM